MSVHDTRNDTEATQRNQFGTFGGVFTPCLLTILGVILFMRSNFVVGQAGIVGAVAILLLAKSITFFTALSTSAISTNMTVRGGGAYYLISRVLGPEFGGAIGIMLFLAQGVSVPFYALGFAEAVTQTFPVLREHGQAVAFATAACLFVVTYVGARWAIKVQYGIMAVLAASIFVFLAGSALRFTPETFAANVWPACTPIDAGAAPGDSGVTTTWAFSGDASAAASSGASRRVAGRRKRSIGRASARDGALGVRDRDRTPERPRSGRSARTTRGGPTRSAARGRACARVGPQPAANAASSAARHRAFADASAKLASNEFAASARASARPIDGCAANSAS